jgi:hypothetical protein
VSRDVIRDFERALRAPGSSPLPRAILELPLSGSEEDAVKHTLHDMLIRTTVLKAFDNLAEFNFKDVDVLYAESRSAGSSEYVVDALNYLRLYQALAVHMRTLALGGSWFGASISRDASNMIAALEKVNGLDPGLMSTKLMLGKLWALQDRPSARQLFEDATAGFEKDLGVFQHDCGATTYFDDASLERDRQLITERRMSLPPRQEYGPMNLEDSRFLIVMSCEQKYMRMYLPYWLSVAEYLEPRGFAYHFLLADSTGEAPEIIDDAEVLSQAMARFRGYDPSTFCRNVSFSSVPVPSWCLSLSSFAASARLLYARDISEGTGMRVITQDVDFCITHDPSPWFDALPVDRIALSSNRVIWTVDPWRKFLGGTYVLPSNELAFTLSRKVEDYLLNGLGKYTSWYLDQNALAYLYETADGDAGNSLFSLAELGPLMRPSRGLDIHYMFKRLPMPVRRWRAPIHSAPDS